MTSLEELLPSNQTQDPIPFDLQRWNSKISSAETARTNFEQQWYMNILFYRGKQWAAWARSPLANSGVALINPKSSRKRLVFNRIMPIIRREFTKLVKEEPQYWVQPNTSDQADVAAAMTGEAIAEYLVEACKFNKAKRTGVWWAAQTGTGFLKTYYDPNKGLSVGPDGAQIAGRPVYSAPSTFHILVPFLEVEEIQDQPWVCEQRCVEPEVIKATYQIDVQPDTAVSTSNLETRFRSAINIKQNNTSKQCLVRELWIKPCMEYPKGAFIVWAESKVLYKSEFPYVHGEFPYQKITHIPSGGFYGFSTIEGLIPMQKEYNLTKSQMSEARDLTSKPALTAVKGSVDISKMKAVPGQVIEYMPGAEKPSRLVNPDMPTYIDKMIEGILGDMDDNSAQYEVSKGRTPPGVEAASAIAYLQEENDTMLYHTVASLEEAVAESGRQSLQLVQQYWTETRIINTVSKSHMQGAIEFKASDLKNNTDLRVVPDSMAPRSRAAKQASVMELIKMEVVPPHVGLKYFQMAETNAMYDELQIDVSQVRRENLRMARGDLTVQVNEYDDDEIHIQEHQQYQKTQEYELLPQDRKDYISEHVRQHKTVFIAENLPNDDGNAESISGTGASELPGPGHQPSESVPL